MHVGLRPGLASVPARGVKTGEEKGREEEQRSSIIGAGGCLIVLLKLLQCLRDDGVPM